MLDNENEALCFDCKAGFVKNAGGGEFPLWLVVPRVKDRVGDFSPLLLLLLLVAGRPPVAELGVGAADLTV